MNYWNLLVIFLSVALAAFLTWRARRPYPSAPIKLIVSLIAVAALACLGTGVYYQQKIMTGSGKPVVIITTGTTADSLDMLKKQSDLLYTFNPQLANDKDPIKLIQSFSQIADAGTVHILGYGLEPGQVADAVKHPGNFVFHAPVLENNFESANWDKKIRLGEQLTVSGTFNNRFANPRPGTSVKDSTKLKIRLEGFGTPLDSVMIATGTISSFALHCFPKQQGRAVYTLTVVKGSTVLQQQKIPFETVPTEPLKILVLAASPDFENRFLKSWLYNNNYGMVVRSLVSKNKFSRESVNMEDLNNAEISNSFIANFDLLISDATALAALPASQKSVIRNAVEQSGLGMIIKADSITSRSFFYNRAFNLNQSSVNNKQQVELHGPDSNTVLPALTIERPIRIDAGAENRIIFSDKAGHHYAASAIAGSGKLVYTSLNNSYSWVLGGDSAAYHSYWSELVQEAARRKSMPRFTVMPAIPVVQEQNLLSMETGDTLPFRAVVEGASLPLAQDPDFLYRWNAVFWPSKTGWQQMTIENGSVFNWYVFRKDEWTDLANKTKIRSNVRALGTVRSLNDINTGNTTETTRAAVPKLYFIIIFIICCFYLWIQEKYYSSRN